MKAVLCRPAKDDIMVISYPKCGGIWVAQIVYLLLNDCVPISDADLFNVKVNRKHGRMAAAERR